MIMDGITTIGSLRDRLARSVEYLVVTDFVSFAVETESGKEVVLNKKRQGNRGYGTGLYTNGYRLNMKRFVDNCEYGIVDEIEVYGRKIGQVKRYDHGWR